VKEIVFRASNRLEIPVVLVASVGMPTPSSPRISTVPVEKGIDSADNYIAAEVAPGDLVITADIPLAGEIVRRGGIALDPRGQRYDENTIGERLPLRNLMMGLRDHGVLDGGGPAPFGQVDRRRFASAFDALVTKMNRE
jgi:hypothetical protein